MPESKRNFTPEAYRELILSLKDRGYKVTDFANVDCNKQHLILRHDVDMSLKPAEEFARIEAEMGVRSSYFVLLRSELYNVYSSSSLDTMKRIMDYGHDIGLHFYASFYNSGNWETLEKACDEECVVLEDIIGKEVKFVSFHRPSQALVGTPKTIGKRHHAYEKRFVKDMGYCSDSRGDWYYGHPMDNPAVKENRAIQLLTHPIWWSSFKSETAIERLERFVLDRFDTLRMELSLNCQPYDRAMAGKHKHAKGKE